MDLTERLDAMEAAIRKPSFRQSSGKANEVNYWIFVSIATSAITGADWTTLIQQAEMFIDGLMQ